MAYLARATTPMIIQNEPKQMNTAAWSVTAAVTKNKRAMTRKAIPDWKNFFMTNLRGNSGRRF